MQTYQAPPGIDRSAPGASSQALLARPPAPLAAYSQPGAQPTPYNTPVAALQPSHTQASRTSGSFLGAGPRLSQSSLAGSSFGLAGMQPPAGSGAGAVPGPPARSSSDSLAQGEGLRKALSHLADELSMAQLGRLRWSAAGAPAPGAGAGTAAGAAAGVTAGVAAGSGGSFRASQSNPATPRARAFSAMPAGTDPAARAAAGSLSVGHRLGVPRLGLGGGGQLAVAGGAGPVPGGQPAPQRRFSSAGAAWPPASAGDSGAARSGFQAGAAADAPLSGLSGPVSGPAGSVPAAAGSVGLRSAHDGLQRPAISGLMRSQSDAAEAAEALSGPPQSERQRRLTVPASLMVS